MAPYSKLYTFATTADKVLMYIGWTSAVVTGVGIPSSVFLIGGIIDSFDPTNSLNATIRTTSIMCIIQSVIGIIVWVLGFVMYSFC